MDNITKNGYTEATARGGEAKVKISRIWPSREYSLKHPVLSGYKKMILSLLAALPILLVFFLIGIGFRYFGGDYSFSEAIDGAFYSIVVSGFSLILQVFLFAFGLWTFGAIGLIFRGASSPLLYIFAIVPIIPVSLFCLPYKVNNPISAIFTVIGHTLGLFIAYLCFWIPGIIYSWALIRRNQAYKERLESAQMIREALSKE